MKVIGVDPGYIKTGYAVVDDLKVLEFGVIDLKGEKVERMRKLVNCISDMVHRYRPEYLVMETAFYGKSYDSAFKLAEIRGAIIGLTGMLGMLYAEYHPAEVKKSVTGNGRAAKSQVIWMVKRLFGLNETINHHAADSLAVIFTHLLKVRAL